MERMDTNVESLSSPPRIPIFRRFRQTIWRIMPILVWVGCAIVASQLLNGEPGPGQLLARATVQHSRISVPVDAELATLTIELGQKVEVNEIIGRLDMGDHEARLRLAKTKLERAKTQITAAKESIRIEVLDRMSQTNARFLAHESGRQTRSAEIGQLLAANGTEEAELKSLAPEIERLRELRLKKLTTADKLQGLERRKLVLTASIAERNRQIDLARRDLKTWELMAPEAGIVAEDTLRLLPYEMQVEAQEARIKELELASELFLLRAPATGIISTIHVGPNEWLEKGTVVAEILIPKPQSMTAFVGDRWIKDVNHGDLVQLRRQVRGGETIEGQVVYVGSHVERIPDQYRDSAHVALWGRRIEIEISDKSDQVPGEVLSMRLKQ